VSFGEEKFGKDVGIHECHDGASKTPPNGADGLEFVSVVSILVKGEEVLMNWPRLSFFILNVA
jgi:hypothetical protein